MANNEGKPSSRTNPQRRLNNVEHYIGQFLDAACETSRRYILELLIPPNRQDAPERYELRVGEIAQQLGLAPSTTSEHLKQLQNLHLVSARKEGNVTYYRLRNHQLVHAFHEMLQALETHYNTYDSSSEAQETS